MKTDKSDIARYIQTEKDLSRFTIMTLERLKDISPSKKRIIEIEKEFLSLPLEKWGFEDMADVASAISRNERPMRRPRHQDDCPGTRRL